MKRSFFLKVGILSLVLAISLSGCKFPWDKGDDSGSGGDAVAVETCPQCHGTGYILVPKYSYDPFTGQSTFAGYNQKKCPTCDGAGIVAASILLSNRGQGLLPE